MVQGADGCTMVTGASDSIGPMTPQPLRFMCSGAVLPLQCFTLGVPTACHPADFNVGDFALHCSGALRAALCPTHSQICGKCVGCNSLELPARHCRAKSAAKFR